jgi:hypothetical protein
MHLVEVSKLGVDVGTISFRGLSKKAEGQRSEFKCSPKGCVPKTVVQKIAAQLTGGVTAGTDEEFNWHI